MYADIIQDLHLWVGPVQPYLICDFVNQTTCIARQVYGCPPHARGRPTSACEERIPLILAWIRRIPSHSFAFHRRAQRLVMRAVSLISTVCEQRQSGVLFSLSIVAYYQFSVFLDTAGCPIQVYRQTLGVPLSVRSTWTFGHLQMNGIRVTRLYI